MVNDKYVSTVEHVLDSIHYKQAKDILYNHFHFARPCDVINFICTILVNILYLLDCDNDQFVALIGQYRQASNNSSCQKIKNAFLALSKQDIFCEQIECCLSRLSQCNFADFELNDLSQKVPIQKKNRKRNIFEKKKKSGIHYSIYILHFIGYSFRIKGIQRILKKRFADEDFESMTKMMTKAYKQKKRDKMKKCIN